MINFYVPKLSTPKNTLKSYSDLLISIVTITKPNEFEFQNIISFQAGSWNEISNGNVLYKQQSILGVGRFGCVYHYEKVTKRNMRESVALKFFIKKYDPQLVRKEVSKKLSLIHKTIQTNLFLFQNIFEIDQIYLNIFQTIYFYFFS